jgi:hypothetical protein
MSKPPLPEAAVALLRKPNPAVITTLRSPGPVLHGRALPAARPPPDQRLDRRGRMARLGCAEGQQPVRPREWSDRSL